MSDINPDTQETANKQGKCKQNKTKQTPQKLYVAILYLNCRKAEIKKKVLKEPEAGMGKTYLQRNKDKGYT